MSLSMLIVMFVLETYTIVMANIILSYSVSKLFTVIIFTMFLYY